MHGVLMDSRWFEMAERPTERISHMCPIYTHTLPRGSYWPKSIWMPCTCGTIIICCHTKCACNDLEQLGEPPNRYHTGLWDGADCFKYYSIISMEILRQDSKLHPSIFCIKYSCALFEFYNVLPPGVKRILMRITSGLQVLDSLLKHVTSLLEHVASAFQSLVLIFEGFFRG